MYEVEAGAGAGEEARRGAPQSSQNASPGRADLPHAGQTVKPMGPPVGAGRSTDAVWLWPLKGVPQASQKATPLGSSIPQLGQYIATCSTFLARVICQVVWVLRQAA